MKVTVRFAHLDRRPIWSTGDRVTKDQVIGCMGDTGQAVGAHLHIDNGEGVLTHNWKLKDAETGLVKPVPRELNRFLCRDLFKGEFHVTTPYADFKYQNEYGKVHLAYDVSTTENWPWPMYWPIEETGVVTGIFKDDAYGNSILIAYDAKEIV